MKQKFKKALIIFGANSYIAKNILNNQKIKKFDIFLISRKQKKNENNYDYSDLSKLTEKLNNRYKHCEYSFRGKGKDLTHHLLEYLKKKYQLQTIGFFLIKKYNDLRYSFSVPYAKEALAKRMFTRDKFIADYDTGYDVYYYCKSDTKVSNQVFEDKDTTNKRYLKKMFMSGMKKRLNSRVLLQNFIKRIA